MSIGSQIRALKILQIEQQPRKKLLHGCIRPMGVPSNGLKLLCTPHSANAAAAAVGDKSVLEKATTGQTLDTGLGAVGAVAAHLALDPILSLSLCHAQLTPPSCIFWTAWIKHSNVSGN